MVANNGSGSGSLSGAPFAQNMSMAAFTAIAWYNVIELNVSIYMTFKRRSGLYFWTLCICSWGIILHNLAFILKFYGVIDNYIISCTIITIGWYAMVTGQSLVLYSRLHLVVRNEMVLRGVLIMIIWNAITLHIPTTVLTFGSASPGGDKYTVPYSIMERIQMTIFCLQEFIISGIYVWSTIRLLKPVYRRNMRSVMLQLFWINIIIIVLDLTLLTTEYLQFYAVETTLKGMVYSIKLKLEFAVLNQLMRLANSSRNAAVMSGGEAMDTNTTAGRAAAARIQATGFKGLFMRLRPGGIDDRTGSRSQVSGDDISSRTAHERNIIESRAISAARSRNRDRDLDDKPSHGITMKTEITQTSVPAEKVFGSVVTSERRLDAVPKSLADPAITFSPGPNHHRRFSSKPYLSSSHNLKDEGDTDDDGLEIMAIDSSDAGSLNEMNNMSHHHHQHHHASSGRRGGAPALPSPQPSLGTTLRGGGSDRQSRSSSERRLRDSDPSDSVHAVSSSDERGPAHYRIEEWDESGRAKVQSTRSPL